jgi:hypothetical protein
MSRRCMPSVRLLGAVAFALLLAFVFSTAYASSDGARSCPVTSPPVTWKPAGPEFGPGRFNYGNARLRASLYWPGGILPAGTLPDGGVMAVIQRDGSIRVKVGWWRGIPGRLVITGRRLDRPGGRVRADVPPNESYGDTGFIPSSIIFPSVGCWRVVGAQASARLVFVVEVTKIRR